MEYQKFIPEGWRDTDDDEVDLQSALKNGDVLQGFVESCDSKYNLHVNFGDKKGIRRYGSCILPMDETLVLCAIDLSGRPYFAYDATFSAEKIGDMDTQMVREFFYALSYSAAMNLHIKVISGENDHHKAEAIFKAFSRALDEAVSFDSRINDVLSTKGSL